MPGMPDWIQDVSVSFLAPEENPGRQQNTKRGYVCYGGIYGRAAGPIPSCRLVSLSSWLRCDDERIMTRKRSGIYEGNRRPKQKKTTVKSTSGRCAA